MPVVETSLGGRIGTAGTLPQAGYPVRDIGRQLLLIARGGSHASAAL